MKLKKLLNHLDETIKVKIYIQELHDDELLYEGYSYEVPWIFSQLYLDTDPESGWKSIFKIEQKENESILCILVKEEK